MFFGLFLVFVATLVIAGLGRLAAVIVMAVGRGLLRTAGTSQGTRPPKAVATGTSAGPGCRSPRKPGQGREAAPSPETRKARQEGTRPCPRTGPPPSRRPMPAPPHGPRRRLPRPSRSPSANCPAPRLRHGTWRLWQPLVESATDTNGQLGTVPPAFKKAPMPAAKSLLDTGSLVSLRGRPAVAPEVPSSGPGAQSRLRPYPRQASRLRLKPMEFRYLGNSGFKISEITFGNWLTHGSQVENEVATQCVRAALDAGISTFDTADVYANTAAETVLGKALQDERRESLEIFTKVFGPTGPKGHNDLGLSRKHIMEAINGSLTRLQTDYVDLYQAHRYDYETPLEETMQAFADIVRQGKALYIGVSEWTAGQIRDGHALAKELGFQLISNQPQYSMLWRVIEAEVIPASEELGLSQIVWSPMAQGVLSGKYHPGKPAPEGSRATDSKGGSKMIERWMSNEVLTGVQQLKPIAEEAGLTMAQLSIAWVLQNKNVASAIMGASRPEQIEKNVAAAGVKLDAGNHGQDRRRDRLAGRTRPGADQVARLPGGLGP